MSAPNRRWFGVVTADVVLDSDLSVAARMVYTTMACYADKTGACFVSNTRVAVTTGYSLATVKRAVKDLTDKGVIVREPRFVEGRQRASVTVLVDLNSERGEPPGVHQ